MLDVGRQAHSTFCLLFQMALGGLPGHSAFFILHSALPECGFGCLRIDDRKGLWARGLLQGAARGGGF